MSEDTKSGMDLWDRGGLEVNRDTREPRYLRVMLIDLENKLILKDQRIEGIRESPQRMSANQAEVVWAEGGSVQIAVAGANPQHWIWSYSSQSWVQGGSPPDHLLRSVFAAMSRNQCR